MSGADRCGLVLLLAGLACCAAGPGEQLPSHHGEEGFRNPYVERKKTSPFAYWWMLWFGDVEFPNPEEAVRIHRDVRARHSIGIQWGASS